MKLQTRKAVLFITTYAATDTPHGEHLPWMLSEAGWEVTVVAPHEKDSAVRQMFCPGWKWRNLKFRTGQSKIASELSLLWELLRARFGRRPVIVLHSQGIVARAWYLFLGPLFGKKLIYHNPDYYDPITYPVRSWMEGRLTRRCDLFIANEYHRAYIVRSQHRLRCPVLVSPPNLAARWPIPSRSEKIRSELDGAVKDAFVLRLNSGFNPLRMVAQVMEALALLPARFRLVMSGGGSVNPKAEELMRRLGIRERVLMLPPLDYAGVLEYTNNADAGVLLYANNDLGNYFTSPGRLTEYLACGLPVLASRYAGLENLVQRFGIGECVDCEDPRSIAAGIQRLESAIASGGYKRAKMRQSFEDHFAFEKWAPPLVEAFNNLVSDKPKVKQAPPPQYWFPGPAEG
jgi:glycosyltransferase involved in cell wall biosynthesis